MNEAKVTKRVRKAGAGKLFDRWATASLKCGRVAVAAADEWMHFGERGTNMMGDVENKLRCLFPRGTQKKKWTQAIS